MKKLFLGVLSAALVLLSASCENKENKDKKKASEFSQNYSWDGKQIEMEGYLFPSSFNMVDDYVGVDLCASKDYSFNRDKIVENVKLLFGKSANSMFFPNKFKMEDVELYDKDGKKLSCLDKVKISGTLVYTAKGPIKVKINKMMPEIMQKKQREEAKKAEGKNDYSFIIKNVVITKL